MKLTRKKCWLKIILTYTISALMIANSTVSVQASSKKVRSNLNRPVVSKINTNGYKLDKVVVLSRHNVRAPMSTIGSTLYRMTPHKWINWSSSASELSTRGGILETEMGQYFRKYLVQQNLFKENEQPKIGSVLFYTNSVQRCIATGQYFSSGFLPIANSKIVYQGKFNTMDPVFNPQLTFVNPSFEKDSLAQISLMGGNQGLQGIEKNLAPDYKLLEKVLDLKHSEIAKQDGYTKFPTNDLNIKFVNHREPSFSGSSLQRATIASDALTLQYYETPNAKRAAFGHNLTYKQWEQIAHIKDVGGDVLFGSRDVAINTAHPLLEEIKKDLNNNSQKFTFLCGHDSNINGVLTALDIKNYSLPNSIEKKTPIGGNVMMEVWQNEKGQKFITFKYVYYSVHQLRHLSVLDLQNPPMIYDLSFNGENKNQDGMYTYNDIMHRFNESINAYNELENEK